LRLVLCQSQDLIVVGEAANAESAVALAQQMRPDVILVEWELPGANGIPVAAVLKAAGSRPAVIATSARPEARRAALAAGADAFVSKLDPPERVLAAMRECATGEHDPGDARRETE
jgi:DNA-binding NarL/FixJ family response regulator